MPLQKLFATAVLIASAAGITCIPLRLLIAPQVLIASAAGITRTPWPMLQATPFDRHGAHTPGPTRWARERCKCVHC
eukprot:353842-Chlamydomonas_euryale.AAC.9